MFKDTCNRDNADQILKTDIYSQDDCPETYGNQQKC